MQETEKPHGGIGYAPPKDELAILILSTNGPFTTTRAVTRACTTKKKLTSQEVIERMKKLQKEGLGVFKEVDKTKAFFKPLPIEDNQEAIVKYIAMEDYRKTFAATEVAYITPSQHDRLLLSAPEEEVLRTDYNVCDRVEPSDT